MIYSFKDKKKTLKALKAEYIEDRSDYLRLSVPTDKTLVGFFGFPKILLSQSSPNPLFPKISFNLYVLKIN